MYAFHHSAHIWSIAKSHEQVSSKQIHNYKMKTIKLLAILCLSIVCSHSYAAQVGDIMLVDGIPAIVISTDETGQHGLVCSSMAVTSNDVKLSASMLMLKEKLSEEEAREMVLSGMTIPVLFYGKKDVKQVKKYTNDLAASNSIYGKENSEQIRAYCDANDVDMAIYFPEQYWASQLGNGWFIPGVHELEQYVAFLTEGRKIGKKEKLRRAEIKAVNAKIEEIRTSTMEDGEAVILPLCVQSSTLIKSPYTKSKEGKKKIPKLSGSIAGAIVQAAQKSKPEYLHLFFEANKVIGSGKFLLLKKSDYVPGVVAFKEF